MLPHITNLNGIVFYHNCSKFGLSLEFMFLAIVWNHNLQDFIND